MIKYSIKLILFLSLTLISNNVYSQSCFKLDSILASSKKYIIGTINQDTLIVEVKLKVSEKMISDAFNSLELNFENRFYLVYNCKIQKKKQTMSFNIIEYRKEYKGSLIEGYEWTSCATFYRRFNKAYFKIRKGEVKFDKWDLE
jgi:hypothetical protein